MLDGFWILKILPPPVATGGVILFRQGKIFGGDGGFTWVGVYTANDRLLNARVHVHNFNPDIKSVLGVDGDYDMHFTGTLDGASITGTAMIANQPQHSLAIRLEKYSEL
jgi:T3SS negative regulator,GrlR